MQTTTVECFLIEARAKRKRVKKLLPLHDLDGKNTSLLTIFNQVMVALVTTPINIPLRQKCAAVRNLISSPTTVSGIMLSGEFGYMSDIININTGAKDYAKIKENAELIPLHFSMLIPNGAHKGVLAIQRFGKQGIKSILLPILTDAINAMLPNIMIELKPLVPDHVMSRYFQSGEVKSITYTQHSIPSDLADKIGSKKTAQEGKVQIIVTATNESFFRPNTLLQSIRNNTVKTIYGIDKIQPDEIDVTIEISGRERTIKTDNLSRLKAAFDISDDIIEGPDGFPDSASVLAAMATLTEDLAKAAGILP